MKRAPDGREGGRDVRSSVGRANASLVAVTVAISSLLQCAQARRVSAGGRLKHGSEDGEQRCSREGFGRRSSSLPHYKTTCVYLLCLPLKEGVDTPPRCLKLNPLRVSLSLDPSRLRLDFQASPGTTPANTAGPDCPSCSGSPVSTNAFLE